MKSPAYDEGTVVSVESPGDWRYIDLLSRV